MALSVGLSHDEFWRLSLRELERIARVYQKTRTAEHEAQVAVSALQTAELVNIVGSAAAGRKWKRVTAKQYFDTWTGKKARKMPNMTMEEYTKREAKIEAGVIARHERRRARRANEQAESHPQNDRTGG